MPTVKFDAAKEKALFAKSNDELKDMLRSEEIDYAENDTKSELVARFWSKEGDVEEKVADANAEAAASAAAEMGAQLAAMQAALDVLSKEKLEAVEALAREVAGHAETKKMLQDFIDGNNEAELKDVVNKQAAEIELLRQGLADAKGANELLAKKYNEQQERIDANATLKGSISDLKTDFN